MGGKNGHQKHHSIYKNPWEKLTKVSLRESSVSVQFSCSVMSNSLQPHESQHARPPCPSRTPRVHSDSRPSSQWCQSSHLILCRPLLLLPPIPPSIRVFSNESTLRMRWPKYWSFSFSIIPSNNVFPLNNSFIGCYDYHNFTFHLCLIKTQSSQSDLVSTFINYMWSHNMPF